MKNERNYVSITIQAAVILLAMAFYFISIDSRSKNPETTDFYKFFKSAQFFINGESVYATIPAKPSVEEINKATPKGKERLKLVHPNMNSPIHVLSVVPFATISFRSAFWIWSCISVAIIVGVVRFMPILPTNRNHAIYHRVNLLLLLLCNFSVCVNLLIGQYGLVLLGISFCLWRASREGKNVLAGIILGVGMSLKVFYGLFLLFYAARKQWKLLCWTIGAFILINVLGAGLMGISTYREYLRIVSESSIYINASWNASSLGFFSRIFGGSGNIPLFNMPQISYGLSLGISLLLIAIIVKTSIYSWDEIAKDRFDIGFSLTTVAMLLISPFGWVYYFPIILIPMIMVWRLCSNLSHHRIYHSAIAIVWVLSNIPSRIINSEEVAINDPAVWIFKAGPYFYSLVLFSLILIILSDRIGWQWPRRRPLSTKCTIAAKSPGSSSRGRLYRQKRRICWPIYNFTTDSSDCTKR